MPEFLVIFMATRSISLSLEEALLADLDAHSTNRSAAVSEAISQWLRHRQVAQLQQAYADLNQLQGGDLEEATVGGGAMGAEALERLNA